MRHPGIPHNCLAILKLGVRHLRLFFVISVSVLYVPLQVKVKMNCSENMPMRTHSDLFKDCHCRAFVLVPYA